MALSTRLFVQFKAELRSEMNCTLRKKTLARCFWRPQSDRLLWLLNKCSARSHSTLWSHAATERYVCTVVYPSYAKVSSAYSNSLASKSVIVRTISTQKPKILHQERRREDQLTEHVTPEEGQLTVGQKVAQAGKDASYSIVLLIGFGVTGILAWYVISELLFSFSPNSVYSKALDIVKENYEVKHIIGEPIKGYGEETSRGRRRHVSFQEYVVDDVHYMRVKFYVSGNKMKGTVFADAKETKRGQFEFRYIFMETQGYPSETVILIDNR